MSEGDQMKRLPVLEATLHKTEEWLDAVADRLGIESRELAYAALRSVLHALRDSIFIDEVAQLGAEMPLLVRGIYYEGWNPKSDHKLLRTRDEFIDAVRKGLRGDYDISDIERAVNAVLEVLEERISEGEIRQVEHLLPRGLRKLWPNAASLQR